ncbi:RNA-protein complex protein Nop10 [Methanothermococcus thermolithotrophicus]|uniref:RNA-protein complex protein Nop10 n=1 Tax=Methanothermococcus thermolithotrophicus TaxID=2186 RepID=UPI00037032AB|nr:MULTISPECIES: RNA-protein complex protein Nop10 [Methanothermococcus]
MRMRKCSKCGKYTLKELCCGENTVTVKPPRFSPEDRYGRYRRILKRSLKK